MLDAEFPTAFSPRRVLEAIGHGERTFGHIRTRAAVNERTLVSALDVLKQKQVVAGEDPRAARTVACRTRYHIADPYLRFWLRFLNDRTDDIARGRGDLVEADVVANWQKYAGEAVEPLLRDAIGQLLPDPRLGAGRCVGSYWGRNNHPQVDLVGTAHRAASDRVEFAGSIKWRATREFDARDAADLDELVEVVPGWDSASIRVGVSRTGFAPDVDLDLRLTPNDLIPPAIGGKGR